MAHPISSIPLDQQVARTSAILLPASAFDVAPRELTCPGFDFVTLFVTYTRAGAGGSVRLRPEFSPVSTGAVWHSKALYGPAVVAAGADAASLEQRETLLYTSTGAGAETTVFGPLDLGGTIERLRIACAEIGAAGTPGTCEILARFSCREVHTS
jgi:hypothetical protein